MYGCLYHDGGSGLWNDVDNVFNHITSHIVFAHGNSKHTTVSESHPDIQSDRVFRAAVMRATAHGPHRTHVWLLLYFVGESSLVQRL